MHTSLGLNMQKRATFSSERRSGCTNLKPALNIPWVGLLVCLGSNWHERGQKEPFRTFVFWHVMNFTCMVNVSPTLPRTHVRFLHHMPSSQP